METRYRAFLDESGQREYDSPDRYYVVLGAIIRIESVDALGHEFSGVKRAFFGTSQVEVKSNWLRQPSESQAHYIIRYSITDKRLRRFVEAVYDWIVSTDITFIAGVIDKVQIQEQYSTPHHPSALGYQVFLQRYQKFLASRHCVGDVVWDDITGASPSGNKWRDLLFRQHKSLRRHGCNYTGMKFPNIANGISFADSSLTPLLQVADIAVYNTFRQFKDYGAYWDDPNAKSLPVYSYFDRLLPRFHQGSNGVFAGFGVAKMPTKAHHKWLAK